MTQSKNFTALFNVKLSFQVNAVNKFFIYCVIIYSTGSLKKQKEANSIKI